MGIADKAVPVNADRSNFNFTMLSNAKPQHGQCPVKIDFSARAAEPRDAIKGQIARIYFYMHDRYDLNMSRQQQHWRSCKHRIGKCFRSSCRAAALRGI